MSLAVWSLRRRFHGEKSLFWGYYETMDSLTHVVTGGVIARALQDEKVGRWGTIAGLAMGAFPDIDFVLGLFNRQFYLQYHRDFTHSVLLIPFYALFFSWIFVKISKKSSFWRYYAICLFALLSHVVLDLLTSYGTMIFSPVSEHRYAWDLLFIIDLFFSGWIILPWLVGFLWKRKAPWLCRGALIGAATYVLFCWVQHERASVEVRNFAKGLKVRVVQTASLPQPLSPFRWANYVETEERVYQGFVDFLRTKRIEPLGRGGEPLLGKGLSATIRKLDRLYDPPGQVRYESWPKVVDSPWVEKALLTDGVRFYYWFARFPVVRSVNSNNGRHRVEFMDARFLVPSLRLPFVYYVEFNDRGDLISEGFVEGKDGRIADGPR